MKIKNFNKGIISSSLGSFWWGFFGTYYFQYITFIGTFEVVVHRSIWTCVILLFLDTWNEFIDVGHAGLFATEKRKAYPINRFQTYLVFEE